MDLRELKAWLAETAWNKHYWAKVGALAKELKSDGCTGVPDWFRWSCLEHDIHYRTHKFICGCKITFDQANYVLRIRVQQGSFLGVFSLISWIRWLGVAVIFRVIAKHAWETYGGQDVGSR